MRHGSSAKSVPVLEIGGTHLESALINCTTWTVVPGSVTRCDFDATESADALIGAMVQSMEAVPREQSTDWAIAIPGPFNYQAGIGLYEHVGKFDSLRGVNLGEELLRRLRPEPASIRFLNDADAFGIGEYAVGAAEKQARAICITLGTGIGSAFLQNGEPINSGPAVPPDGSAHRIHYRGRPLEETVSRRAIISAYAAAVGSRVEDVPDVRQIADLSRKGDQIATEVLSSTFTHLGAALASAVARFSATSLIVGGSMSNSWDIVEPALRDGLVRELPALASLQILRAEKAAEAALIGAAFWCHQKALRTGA